MRPAGQDRIASREGQDPKVLRLVFTKVRAGLFRLCAISFILEIQDARNYITTAVSLPSSLPDHWTQKERGRPTFTSFRLDLVGWRQKRQIPETNQAWAADNSLALR